LKAGRTQSIASLSFFISSSMTPKPAGVITLAGLDPSPEEVAAATKMLALSGKAKYQMQYFTNWLKKNPTEENEHIRKNTKGQ